MKFAVSLFLSAAVYAADATSLYPSGTRVYLKCDMAQFDPAGAAPGGPVDPAGCSANCMNDLFGALGTSLDDAGQAVGLSADRYAGCTFIAAYFVTEGVTAPCPFSSSKGAGFFLTVDSTNMVTKDVVSNATYWPIVTTPDTASWDIYHATSASASCSTSGGSEDWITGAKNMAKGNPVGSKYQVDFTPLYHFHNAENGKMYIFVVPGGNTKVDGTQAASVTTLSLGPMQMGVSAACGAKKDCATCVPGCTWCQLSVGSISNGVCGVTEGQCYGIQQAPFVGWYKDQCTTPVTAGARSAMMLSVAGAVLMGAALAL